MYSGGRGVLSSGLVATLIAQLPRSELQRELRTSHAGINDAEIWRKRERERERESSRNSDVSRICGALSP